SESSTLSLHDALPISSGDDSDSDDVGDIHDVDRGKFLADPVGQDLAQILVHLDQRTRTWGDSAEGLNRGPLGANLIKMHKDLCQDRKSTRLNSSHVKI